MPVMLFLFANNAAFAGNMRMEDAITEEDVDAIARMTLDEGSNIQVVEGIDSSVDVSIAIPLEDDVETERINVYENKSASLINITIPTGEKNFYYKNELTGSQKGIASLLYDYADGIAEFNITTDGYYISTLHLTPDELYLELSSPKELYGHVFVVDASHGGEDAGSTAYGVSEKDIALGIARAMADSANASGDGGLYLTRNSDEDVSAEDRERLISLMNPEMTVTLRVAADADTRTTNGVSAVVGSSADERQARALLGAIATETGQADLGVTIDSSAGENHGITVYLGYITNKAEALQMGSEQYQSKLGSLLYAWLLQLDQESEND